MKRLVVSALLFVCMFMFGCAKEQKQSVVAVVNGVEISDAEFNRAFTGAVNFVNSQNPQSLKEPFASDLLGKRVLNDMIIRELFLQQARWISPRRGRRPRHDNHGRRSISALPKQ